MKLGTFYHKGAARLDCEGYTEARRLDALVPLLPSAAAFPLAVPLVPRPDVAPLRCDGQTSTPLVVPSRGHIDTVSRGRRAVARRGGTHVLPLEESPKRPVRSGASVSVC